MNNIKDHFNPRVLSIIMGALACFLVALLVFQAGVYVGYHKAAFSQSRDLSYRVSVDDPRSVFAPFMRDPDDPAPHGAVGDIVSFHDPLLMIKGSGTAEEIVMIGPGTSIRKLHTDATTTDLTPGEQVIVIGTPDDQGQLQASFIRILPTMPQATSTAQ